MISDADKRRALDVEDSRDCETIEKFSYKLEAKGEDSEKITTFVSDMSMAYIGGKDLCFLNAQFVIDKFHIKKLMLDAVDEVRRAEQGKQVSKRRNASKKLLMIPEIRQTKRQKEAVFA